jgi:hypothetical protein
MQVVFRDDEWWGIVGSIIVFRSGWVINDQPLETTANRF